MSYPLVIRLMLAMALMPDASYGESLARLAGLLADVPFALEWHVPTGKVITEWRLLIPADVMEDLFWQAAGPLISDDEPSAALLAGMMVCAADGMLVNLPTRTGRSGLDGYLTISPERAHRVGDQVAAARSSRHAPLCPHADTACSHARSAVIWRKA